MHECPYCGREYINRARMFSHACDVHGEAILALWVDWYGHTPLVDGQQRTLQAVVG